MELFILKSLVFLLFFIEHSVGQNVATSPVEAYLGENTTLKILVETTPSSIIIWNFKDDKEPLNVATLRRGNLTANDRYRGRASIDLANGHLTLTSVKLEDSGNYSVTILNDHSTLTGIVQLHVLDVRHPNLTLVGPSSEEVQQDMITLKCLAIKGSPSDWSLHWEINASSQIDWEEEWNPGMLQDDELYSWSSVMTTSMENWKKIFTVTCRARLGSLVPVAVSLNTNQTSQA